MHLLFIYPPELAALVHLLLDFFYKERPKSFFSQYPVLGIFGDF
jgi:hypothetical protein